MQLIDFSIYIMEILSKPLQKHNL
uniref:Uncharacterized protein n=1 Tax=Rhizophora mucronata TaxID=61149 RepID=A0A2P2PB57_RHIMU